MKASMRGVTLLFFGICASLALTFSACTPPSPNDGGNPDSQTCKTAGCTCQANQDCGDGLECTQGTCQSASEATPDAGEVVPEKSDCVPGTAACRCTPTGACNSGLRCENNLCQSCPEGTAGCACKSDSTCNTGLKCESGVCAGCTGQAGCPCYGNGNCDAGSKCTFSSNGASQCLACKTGEEDCNCEKDTECGGSLICVNKRCMDATKANAIPKSPKCYSACEGDVKTKDGQLKVCHPQYKLVDDCPAGQTCSEGSCLSSEQIKQNDSKAYPYCNDDSNCPSWQACVQGRCYSTCRSTSECPNGFQCFSYVCRRECNVRTNACDNQSTCHTQGSDSGVCTPKSNNYQPNTPAKTVAGNFTITYRSLSLTRINAAQNIVLTNNSANEVDFSISRSSDTLSSAKPLSWLKFDLCKTYGDDGKSCTAFEGRPTAQDPFTVPKVAAGKLAIVRVSGGDGKPQDSKAYDGILKVQTTQLGTQEFNVSYRESLDGQWKGTMVAFGNFEDTNIDKFPASDTLDLRTLKNSFLRRWLNFKRREIDRDQFFAMLHSVREGTWQYKKVADDCRKAYSTQASEDVLCYPYASSKGYEILSYSQREAPPPSGASELSFAINLKQSNDTLLEGRIETSQTLQYAGNPQIQIKLAEAVATKTLVPLSAMSATIDIGGRFYV
ncbi:MAG: hypothetical protein H6727_21285, partial [Myxococcales bacterium]|nr:hypothetical protein [Myxococcales bacterium]